LFATAHGKLKPANVCVAKYMKVHEFNYTNIKQWQMIKQHKNFK